MATNVRRHSYGTVLKYATIATAGGTSTTSGSPTTVSDIVRVKLPKLTRAKVDATDLDSSANAKEVAPLLGWIDSDDVELDCHFTETQYAAVRTLFNNGTEVMWQAHLPLVSSQTTKALITFPGIVTGLENPEASSESDATLRCNFTISRTVGVPTFTAGS